MSQAVKMIKPPRPLVIDFILSCATFSVFLCVWLYQGVRDLNRIRPLGLTPWLWFFVPILLIPAFFALPILLKKLREVEAHYELASWSVTLDRLWLVSVLGLSVASVAVEYSGMSVLQQFGVLGLWIFSYLMLAPRLSRVRAASELPKVNLYAKLSNIEWVVTLIFVPILALVIWFVGLQTYFVSIDKIQEQQVVQEQNLGVQLTFASGQWHQVEIGTHSNGEGDMEFSGYQSDASMIIFEQDNRAVISDLIHWRIDEAYDFLDDASCTESRAFLPNSTYLRISVHCQGTVMGDPSLQMHELVQIGEDDYVELYAKFSALDARFEQSEASFLSTVRSFSPIVEGE
ncbi:hypothetical protein KJ365_11765 [Glaciecola sp. XM2]|uniref:hypothetical protein n=1 Tax=Glaciecola sp. XM2 TaxID=1914931 RepID=UPI001BDF370B|nr:hypothetical protein [Glaciecola sp. XM2]MBT1451558.1 hypothetical protein [Glaciecola sp. XM2]